MGICGLGVVSVPADEVSEGRGEAGGRPGPGGSGLAAGTCP